MTTPADRPQPRPSVFFIKNHSSDQLFSGHFDEFIKRPSRHAEFAGDKPRFLEWCHAPSTDHAFFSLVEPQDCSLRATKENSARLLHGLVADYDASISRAELLAGIGRASTDYPVAYASETFSKGARLVWLFEKPLPLFDPEHTKQLLKTLRAEMRLTKLLPGLDEPAFLETSKYYELGRDWLAMNPEARVSIQMIGGHSIKAAMKQDFSAHGPAIPIEHVAAEVECKFPGRWRGPFVVGARGVRFWDDAANNEAGALILDNGVMAFSGEQRFKPWSEILGSDFVRKFEQDRIALATQDVYLSEDKKYWRRINGVWRTDNTETLRRHLKNNCGLSDRTRAPGSSSEIERAISFVETSARIDGAAPFLFRDSTLVRYGTKSYLNVARAKPVWPEDVRRGWGDGFPWIAGFLETLFPDDEQRHVFLGWLARFYVGAIESRPVQGQVLVIAGPAEAGKTLLSSCVIGPLVGGSHEATSFLTGQTEFNGPLFHSPVWTVDDATGSTDPRTRTVFTENLKKLAANMHQTFREMYQSPVQLEFVGRAVCTLNDDDESLGMLPLLSHSADDKFIFLLASSAKEFVQSHGTGGISAELRAFGAFLRDFKLPEAYRGTPRFGVVAYKHPVLRARSEDSSPDAQFFSVINLWRTGYFKSCQDTEWDGNAAELLRQLYLDESLRGFQKSFGTAQQIGRRLARAKQCGIQWIKEAPRHKTLGARYTILPPEKDAAEPRAHRVTVAPDAA